MWKKHRSVFQDHIKYIYNDIVKLFRVGILRQAERVQEMHDLDKKLPPPWMNGESYESANWDVRDRYLSENQIRVVIKGGIPSSMQDDLEDN